MPGVDMLQDRTPRIRGLAMGGCARAWPAGAPCRRQV